MNGLFRSRCGCGMGNRCWLNSGRGVRGRRCRRGMCGLRGRGLRRMALLNRLAGKPVAGLLRKNNGRTQRNGRDGFY